MEEPDVASRCTADDGPRWEPCFSSAAFESDAASQVRQRQRGEQQRGAAAAWYVSRSPAVRMRDTSPGETEPKRAASGTGLLVVARGMVWVVDPESGAARGSELDSRAACLAVDPFDPGRVWCGSDAGVLRSDDAGLTWRRSGLEGENVTALAASPARPDLLWAGTEPSAVWRSENGGTSWARADGLLDLPSASGWSFPPRPESHHVRWIGCHPAEGGRLWIAIEAGALVATPDGGRTWLDRVPGGPYDTHQLAIHPARPEWLRSAAGDGYFESRDGGASWSSPEEGLEVGYLVSVALDPGDPDIVVVSAASSPFSAYRAGHADGRIYRREGRGRWERILRGWPDPPASIAPRLVPGTAPGELWAADERGVHGSRDGGRSWELAGAFDSAIESVAALDIVES